MILIFIYRNEMKAIFNTTDGMFYCVGSIFLMANINTIVSVLSVITLLTTIIYNCIRIKKALKK